MDYKIKKLRKSMKKSESHPTLPEKAKREDNFVTIEVVSLRDMPLWERHKEANKPLYLTRYE